MIINFIESIKCKFKGHEYVPAGSCPFTGKTYNICIKCTKMISV